MAQPIASLIVNVAADVSELKTGVSQANETLTQMGGAVANLEESFGSFEGVVDRVVERLAIYETVRKGIEFAETAFEDAAALEDLSVATGVNTDALQRLDYVGQTYGITSDMMTRAVETFSTKLGGGDAGATRAVEMLGLNVQDLIAMGPDRAFETFTAAAAGLQDPMDRNAAYADVFGGRLGKLLGSLGDVTQAMKDVPRDAIIDPDVIENAHDFDVMLQHATTTLKAYSAEVTNAVGGGIKDALGAVFSGGDPMAALLSGTFSTAAFSEINGVLKGVGLSFEDVTTSAKNNSVALHDNATAATDTTTHDQEVQNWLTSLRAGYASLTETQRSQIETAHEANASTSDIAKTLQLNEAAVTSYVKSLDEQKKAQDELNKAINDLDSTGLTWKDTLAGIDAATVVSVKNYLAAGVSQHDLATAYGLTAAQIKAADLEMRADAALTKQQNDENKASLTELTSLWQQYDQLRSTHGHTTTEQQVADIQAWRDKVIESAQKAGIATTEFYDTLDTLTKEKTADILVDWQAVNTVLETQTPAALQQTADKAQATYQALAKLAETRAIPDATLQQFRDAADNAQLAANDFGNLDTSMTATASTSTTTAKTVASDWSSTFGTLRQQAQTTTQVFSSFEDASKALVTSYRKAGLFVDTTSIGTDIVGLRGGSGVSASFETGGYGNFGDGTLAMLHGLEAIIPADKLAPLLSLASGSAVSAGGGHTFNIAITVPPGTPAQQGRAMGDALIARLQGAGVRL